MNGREQYIEESKNLIRSFLNESKMVINYVREEQYRSRPEGMVIDKQQADAVFTLLDVTGGVVSSKNCLTMLKVLLPESLQLTEDQFVVLRKEWKWKRSPMRGAVVAYTVDNNFYLGWSLCNPQDEWNRYIGCAKAIKTAIEWKDLLDDHIKGACEIPHSVLPTLKKVIFRMAKTLDGGESGEYTRAASQYQDII
jgi:hypothetical protein